MKKTTLLIMAAGLGSRYGGNKQVDGIGPHGEILMQYSIYDAIKNRNYQPINLIVNKKEPNITVTILNLIPKVIPNTTDNFISPPPKVSYLNI